MSALSILFATPTNCNFANQSTAGLDSNVLTTWVPGDCSKKCICCNLGSIYIGKGHRAINIIEIGMTTWSPHNLLAQK